MSKHTSGYKFAFGFNAPEDLFEKELYYDDALKLPYYRVYGKVNPRNHRYFFTSSTDGKDYMVTRAKKNLPVVSCEICGNEAMYSCGKCESGAYCSRECQKIDWINHAAQTCKK